jgi:hypothetical protein
VNHSLKDFSECKIKALAANVVGSLEYDVSALPVLETIGTYSCDLAKSALDVRLRDAILKENPAVLQLVLKAACINENAFERVTV